jgi:mono/diheme cytochrome c family protein
MTPNRTFLFACTVLATTVIAGVSASARQSQPSWNQSFSAVQADRGAALYAANCVACHGKDLAGGERAPAAGGPGLVARWANRPLVELLDYIQVQMPLTSPNGLTRRQNADILAFMLESSGAAPGPKDLWFDGPDGGSPPPKRSADYGKVAEKSTKRAEAVYTSAQAARGKVVWNRNCAFCHSVDPKNSTAKDIVQPLPSTFGGMFLTRVVNDKVVYPNVLALYSKLTSMPAFNTHAISEQERVDVATYIMQMNGLPAGNTEVPVNVDAMRLMMLNEPGFERIFNGRDLSGWNILLGPNCGAPPAGCSRTEPLDVLRVEDEMIVCECHVHGHLYTDKKYFNFTLRFDTRFERPAEFGPEDDDELFSGGSGYKIFTTVSDAGFLTKYLEVEGRHRDILELVRVGGGPAGPIGQVDLEAKRRAIRPLGEWNAIEISAKDGFVQTKINGAVVASAKTDYTEAGHIAFQSQGARMFWRNIRIRVD